MEDQTKKYIREGQQFELCFRRPRNYFKLDGSEQWRIDDNIGLLDWNGGCYHEKQLSKCANCHQRFVDYFSMM